MFCCGGAEEESHGPPAHQYTAPPRGGNMYGGGNILQPLFKLYLVLFSQISFHWLV